MSSSFGPRTLGRSGLRVGALGISSSFGAPVAAYQLALERGCNYWTWGTFIKGRNRAMGQALRQLIRDGRRDDVVLAMYSYAHNATLMEFMLRRGLRWLGTDHVDVLILGYHPKRPGQAQLDRALRLREQGVARHLGLSGHDRPLFASLVDDVFDVFHIRYNAAHRGAEREAFPALLGEAKPGVVSFTATRWGKLLKVSAMPAGEAPLSAVDCYRFCLSHPAVQVCLTGTRSVEEMQQNLQALAQGPLSDEEMVRVRRIGDHVYGRRTD